MASGISHPGMLVTETESVCVAQDPPVASLGEIPLLVISHGKLDANTLPPSLGPQVRQEYEQSWQNLPMEITFPSWRGRLVWQKKSRHNTFYEQPEIIIRTVCQMLEQYRPEIRPAVTPVEAAG